MADERPQSSNAENGDPAAAALALVGASREQADEFLRRQCRLADLQIENMRDLDAFELSHLRWRRFNDQMSGALQIILVVLAVAVFIGLCVTIWSAAHDDGLVIEAFSVPPDLAARGLTGPAVAAQLQDRLTAMQDATDTARPANSYAKNWGDDIKVQIPDTGISVGEFYRLLVGWFGNQTHISGEVWHDGDNVSITARAGSVTGATVTGRETEIPALLQKSAEAVYRQTQPYRYAVYVSEHENNDSAAVTILRRLAVEGTTRRERAWAEAGLDVMALHGADLPTALAHVRAAVALEPDFSLGWDELKWFESVLGHEESSLKAGREAVRLMGRVGDGMITERSRKLTFFLDRAETEADIGDFGAAFGDYMTASQLPEYGGEAEGARETTAFTLVHLHEFRAARAQWQALPDTDDPDTRDGRASFLPNLYADMADWPGVLSARQAAEAALARGEFRHQAAQLLWPYFALALANTGHVADAEALIAKTPLDCDVCVGARGRIAALQRHWTQAERWFALVSQRTPSIPFADTDWGAMLLHQGRYDAAIAKFTLAHDKGPHFADPLEMWGEALMQKNRSDLALPKFEEAAKYAPNWGRLHLKWGEALFYAGKPQDAKKQFAIASALSLPAADTAALAQWKSRHG